MSARTPAEDPIRTPCVGVCSTVYGDRVCRGCKRFAHEIIRWNGYDAAGREAILARLEQLTAQIVSHRIEVTDAAALEAALQRFRVRFHRERCAAHRVAELIRTSADRMVDPADCGLRVLPPWNGLPLARLRDLMEEELIALSEAYLDRYFPEDATGPRAQGDLFDG